MRPEGEECCRGVSGRVMPNCVGTLPAPALPPCYRFRSVTNVVSPKDTIGTNGLAANANSPEAAMREDSVYMSAHAETVAEAFSAAIARMLDDSCPGDARRRDGSLFAPIRAEAGDLPALFAGLVESVRGESDNLGMPVAGARIDGVVRSDDGFVAWGVIELDRDARPT